ncbi:MULTISPECIES: IclR family transcriptional regulator [unclassified Pseudomonas]|uniref:IclR family transcriptional regulator n=1 Tax=unclassified Pseudomonas TaxID=196821 RepID=UPI002AC8E9B9|nr:MULTISPECIES: IclR family transcriptional regulator [unclassified Pseudomonas]MEB0042567.1 IclR family transcriptional regulator [Pseudomonas sp. MH10]MEB0123939.1 IclR family transcriptional regulator [Pseudomonas sp. CCI1.2]WPX64502.1 IclR family transcriptional regulator [Pseudomonas sp. MH10]
MNDSVTKSLADRVLQVLACVAKAGQPIGAKRIAAHVGIPLSTVYRHLAALKKWGLLQEHMTTGLYEPGATGVQLAWGFDQTSNLVNQSRDEISALVERTGESVGLLVHSNGQMVCIAMEESSNSLRCSFTKGRAHSMMQGASAKSLLAFLPEQTRRRIIAKQLGDSPQSETLEKEIAEIRTNGFATSDSEVDLGVWGVSVPLISQDETLEGTVTLMAPSLRVGPREAELISLTRKAASRICNRF